MRIASGATPRPAAWASATTPRATAARSRHCRRAGASFTAGANGTSVAFSDTSQAGPGGSPIAARTWDFGDGTTSTDQNPTHAYAVPGTYTVTLTVTDENGFAATAIQPVVVPAQP